MTDQSPFQVAPYSALAAVYNRAGLAVYVEDMVPRCISIAQSMDWAGRRVIDVGCGTGVSTWWLAQHGYRVTGVDNNAHMLEQAHAYVQSRIENTGPDDFAADPPDFERGDIRSLKSSMGHVDMVLALGGVINAIQSLRELEQTFKAVGKVLDLSKLFVFDARTIRGLATDLGDSDCVYFDNGHNLMVVIRNQFSFETLSNTRHYSIYRQANMVWSRQDEIHVERGYPTQGITAMLERTGFQVAAVLTPEMSTFDMQRDEHGRAIFIAQKVR